MIKVKYIDRTGRYRELGDGRTDLAGADLAGADLSDADLSGCDLSRANLSNANLSGADLTGVDLNYTYMQGADLSNTIFS